MTEQEQASTELAPARAALPALRADDEVLHPLMRHVLAGGEAKGGKRFFKGLTVPLQAVKFLLAHRQLWPNVIWPALINLTLFAGALYLFVTQGSALFGAVWAQPVIEVWYHYLLVVLWYVVYALVMALSVMIAYVSSVLVGGVLASPFNDIISEKTERLLLGERHRELEEGPFWPGLLRSAASSAAMAGMYVAVMGPLLLLNLIPFVGSVAYTVLGGGVGGYFLALEYSDTLLERHHFAFRDKIGVVWRERSFTIGFGVGTSLMLAIPLVNFLCIPIAVIGGTAVGLGLEQWDGRRLPAPDEAPALSDEG